ncbi:hypothetical protein CR513_43572, partial [Mucuna pruriens]
MGPFPISNGYLYIISACVFEGVEGEAIFLVLNSYFAQECKSLILAHQVSLDPRESSRLDQFVPGQAGPTTQQPNLKKRRTRTKRLKVGKGDRLARHHTLLDLILSDLANRGHDGRDQLSLRLRRAMSSPPEVFVSRFDTEMARLPSKVQPSSARHKKPRPRLGPCKPVIQPGHPGGTPRQQSKTTSVPAQTPHHLLGSLQRKSQQGLGTEKPKVIRGDRLEHQRTLVDLNLSILASRGESSPSSMAIVVEDGIIESRPCRLSALSRDRAGLSLPRLTRPSLCRERLGQRRDLAFRFCFRLLYIETHFERTLARKVLEFFELGVGGLVAALS